MKIPAGSPTIVDVIVASAGSISNTVEANAYNCGEGNVGKEVRYSWLIRGTAKSYHEDSKP